MLAESVQGVACEQLPPLCTLMKTALLANSAAAPSTSPLLLALKNALTTAARSDGATCCALAGAALP